MNADYGVKYPCYGEYKCPKCKRDWNSNRAWRTTGQKCKTCNEFRTPFRVEPLYSFVCLKKGCGSQWKHKFVDVSLCSKCGNPGKRFETPKQRHEYITANKLAIASPSWGEETEHVAKSGHLTELCEKCQKSKYKDCRRQAFEDAQKLRRNPLWEVTEKLEKTHLVIQKPILRSTQPVIPTPVPAVSAWAVKSEKKPKQQEVPTPRPVVSRCTVQNQSQNFKSAPAPAPTNTELRPIEQRRRINETSNYNNHNAQQYKATFYDRPRPAAPPRAESSCILL